MVWDSGLGLLRTGTLNPRRESGKKNYGLGLGSRTAADHDLPLKKFGIMSDDYVQFQN